jgi:ubiquinone/menaquinone biosynthesis C-methylase UbiE
MATLNLLDRDQYQGVNGDDPIRFYYWPVFGRMYRRRVEMCLEQCAGGERVLEIGFGTGLTFLNLSKLYREIHGLDLTADAARVSGVFSKRGIATDLRQGNVLNMPYPDGHFDTVLLISILEHLKPEEQAPAFAEIRRVLKPGGQVVYGVPIERPLMVMMFRVLGYDIRLHHFSTHGQVRAAAAAMMEEVRVVDMPSMPRGLGHVYEIGHFNKSAGGTKDV